MMSAVFEHKFFTDGVLPASQTRIEQFFDRVASMTRFEEPVLREEIAGLSRMQMMDFAERILAQSDDERLLRAFYMSPAVHRIMGLEGLEQYFYLLCSMAHDEIIHRDLFEDLASHLVSSYPNPRALNLLPSMHRLVTRVTGPGGTLAFNSPAFDNALASHLGSVIDKTNSNDEQIRSWDGLRQIHLPETFRVFMEDIKLREDFLALRHIAVDLFTQNRISPGYLEVLRGVLGDDALVSAYRDVSSCDHAMLSIVKLLPVWSESTFHDEQWLSYVQQTVDKGWIPADVNTMFEEGISEQQLPILAGFVMQNLDRLMDCDLKSEKGRSLRKNIARMAKRMGFGAEALMFSIASASLASSVSMGVPQPAGAAERIDLLSTPTSFSAPVTEVNAYNHILDITETVGLETLLEVAPSIHERFVVDFMNTRKTAMPMRDLLKMFPQCKGLVLENDLGM